MCTSYSTWVCLLRGASNTFSIQSIKHTLSIYKYICINIVILCQHHSQGQLNNCTGADPDLNEPRGFAGKEYNCRTGEGRKLKSWSKMK